MNDASSHRQAQLVRDFARRAQQACRKIAEDIADRDPQYSALIQKIKAVKHQLHRQRLLVARRRFSLRTRLASAKKMRGNLREAKAGEAALLAQLDQVEKEREEQLARFQARVECDLAADNGLGRED